MAFCVDSVTLFLKRCFDAGCIFVIVGLLFTVFGAATSYADLVIAEETAGTQNTFQFAGESVTTGVGVGWDNLRFNFFNGGGGDLALGTLFLLDREYLGTPDALSSATTGFLAASTSISANRYNFDPSVQIDANTTYYFYSDTVFTSIQLLNNVGADDYASSGSSSAFFTGSSFDWNFRLTGTAVPESGTFAVMSLVTVGLILRRRRTAD